MAGNRRRKPRQDVSDDCGTLVDETGIELNRACAGLKFLRRIGCAADATNADDGNPVSQPLPQACHHAGRQSAQGAAAEAAGFLAQGRTQSGGSLQRGIGSDDGINAVSRHLLTNDVDFIIRQVGGDLQRQRDVAPRRIAHRTSARGQTCEQTVKVLHVLQFTQCLRIG